MVKVHWNTHKKLWSVYGITKKVCHMHTIVLSNCTMMVSEKGRIRCLSEGIKNVHAFIKGEVIKELPVNFKLTGQIKYNPFTCGYFFNYKTHNKVETTKYCVFSEKGTVWY